MSIELHPCSLVAEDGVALGGKPKSVYCYLTPKQLTIKSYLLRFIPRRLYTFRLVPATRITLSRCVTNKATRSMFYRTLQILIPSQFSQSKFIQE